MLFAKIKFSRKFPNGDIYCHSFMQINAIKYISLDWSVIELVWKKSKITHLSRMDFPTTINCSSPFPILGVLGDVFFSQILIEDSVNKQ